MFEGKPLMVQTYGSEEKGMTVIGFIIYDATNSKLIHCGDVYFGVTSNEVELYAIL